jgi:hypothetical protein
MTKRKTKTDPRMPTTKKGRLHYLLIRNALSVAQIA